jgi:hypothetical protein
MKVTNIKIEDIIRVITVMKKNNVDYIDLELIGKKLTITPSDIHKDNLTIEDILKLII